MYSVVIEKRKIGGYGRRKDEIRELEAPAVLRADGSGIAFRPGQEKLAHAAAKALNDGVVHMGGGPLDRFLCGKYAEETLRKFGYY